MLNLIGGILFFT